MMDGANAPCARHEKGLSFPADERTTTVGDGKRECGDIMTTPSDTDSLSVTSSSSSFTKPCVSFGEVHVHEFAQWLGDNPSVSAGPPIALSWNRVNTKVLKIDEYETNRGRRRSEQELITCVQQRINVIKWCLGHTDDEIAHQERQVSKYRRSRESSARRYRRKKKVKNILTGAKVTSLKLLGRCR